MAERSAAGWGGIAPDAYVQAAAAVDQIRSVWRNDYRYRSHRSVLRYLKDKHLDRRTKGDVLKTLSRQTYDNAVLLVQTGVELWKQP